MSIINLNIALFKIISQISYLFLVLQPVCDKLDSS